MATRAAPPDNAAADADQRTVAAEADEEEQGVAARVLQQSDDRPGETDLVIGENVVIEEDTSRTPPRRRRSKDPRPASKRFAEQFGQEGEREDAPEFKSQPISKLRAAPKSDPKLAELQTFIEAEAQKLADVESAADNTRSRVQALIADLPDRPGPPVKADEGLPRPPGTRQKFEDELDAVLDSEREQEVLDQLGNLLGSQALAKELASMIRAEAKRLGIDPSTLNIGAIVGDVGEQVRGGRTISLRALATSAAKARRRGREADKTSILLPSGERVDIKDFKKLTKKEQTVLRAVGIEGLNKFKIAELAEFETKHVKLDNGEFVLKSVFDKLDVQSQAQLKEFGVGAFNSMQLQEITVDKKPTKLSKGLSSPPRQVPPGVAPGEIKEAIKEFEPAGEVLPPFIQRLTADEQAAIDAEAQQLIQRSRGTSGGPVREGGSPPLTLEDARIIAANRLGITPNGRNWLGDALRTVLSLGRVPVPSSDKDRAALRKDYQALLDEAGAAYTKAKEDASDEGATLTESRLQYIARAVPFTEDEYVQGVLAAAPSVKELLKEISLNSVPIFGTVRTWEDSPAWARAIGVASDLLFLLPFVGFAAAQTRTGASVVQSVSRTGSATFRGPVQIIQNPIKAAGVVRNTRQAFETARLDLMKQVQEGVTKGLTQRKAALAAGLTEEELAAVGGDVAQAVSIKTLADLGITAADVEKAGGIFEAISAASGVKGQAKAATIETVQTGKRAIQSTVDPVELLVDVRRVPISAVEIRGTTTRLQVQGTTASTSAGNIATAEGRAVKEASDLATFSLIRGGEGTAPLGDDLIKLARSPTNKTVQQAAFHSSPDIRFTLNGFEAQGTEGGMFLSPNAHTRFTVSSAFGATGGDDAMPGIVMITDPKILDQMISSEKLFKGMAEFEAIIPNKIQVPAPSQFLRMRNTSGDVITLAIIGEPLSPAQVLKMRVLGSANTITNMFRGTLRVKKGSAASREADEAFDEMTDLTRQADELFAEASAFRGRAAEAFKAGRTEDGADFARLGRSTEEEARRLRVSADRAGDRLGAILAPNVAWSPGAMYFGDQDLDAALDVLGGKGRAEAEAKQRRINAQREADADATAARGETVRSEEVRATPERASRPESDRPEPTRAERPDRVRDPVRAEAAPPRVDTPLRSDRPIRSDDPRVRPPIRVESPGLVRTPPPVERTPPRKDPDVPRIKPITPRAPVRAKPVTGRIPPRPQAPTRPAPARVKPAPRSVPRSTATAPRDPARTPPPGPQGTTRVPAPKSEEAKKRVKGDSGGLPPRQKTTGPQRFPVVHGWRQGGGKRGKSQGVFAYVDRSSGEAFFSSRPLFGQVPTSKGATPQETHRVIRRGGTRQPVREVAIGNAVAIVSDRGIMFRGRKGKGRTGRKARPRRNSKR